LTLFNASGLTGILKVFGERQPAGVVIYQGPPVLKYREFPFTAIHGYWRWCYTGGWPCI